MVGGQGKLCGPESGYEGLGAFEGSGRKIKFLKKVDLEGCLCLLSELFLCRRRPFW